MKIKILHIIDKYSYGGVETIAYNLIQSFRSESSELTYLFLRDLNNKDKLDQSNVIIKNYSRTSIVRPLLGMLSIIHSNDIKIIHTHHRKSFYLAVLLSLFTRNIYYVHHEHSDIVPPNLIYKIACNTAFKRNFKFIAVSTFLKDLMLKKTEISNESIFVIPNFVNLDKFKQISYAEREDARKKLGLESELFTFGFAGRLIERKGWLDFVQACKLLDSKGVQYCALIAGDGPDLGALKNEVAKQRIGHRVKVLGFCNDMHVFYSALDCFVIPSHWEGLPMAQLEVMASGIPMISSDGPGLTEVCTDNFDCLNFAVMNVEMLAAKMSELQHDPELQTNLKECALKTANNYSLEKYIESLDEFYVKLLSEQK